MSRKRREERDRAEYERELAEAVGDREPLGLRAVARLLRAEADAMPEPAVTGHTFSYTVGGGVSGKTGLREFDELMVRRKEEAFLKALVGGGLLTDQQVVSDEYRAWQKTKAMAFYENTDFEAIMSVPAATTKTGG